MKKINSKYNITLLMHSYKSIKKNIEHTLKSSSKNSVLLCLLLTSCTKAETPTQILFEGKNEFGEVYVYQSEIKSEPDLESNQGMLQCMSFEQLPPKARQSCFITTSPNLLYFPYTKMIVSTLLLGPAPKQILIIGLGGASLVNAYRFLLPDTKIDVIELNPLVYQAAKEYFGFKEDDKTRVYLKEAYSWMNNIENDNFKYDLIVMDAFDANYIPAQFLTAKFTQMLKSKLNPEGLAVINTFKNSPYFDLETKIYKETFNDYYEITDRNRLLILKNGKLPTKSNIKLPTGINEDSLIQIGLTKEKLFSYYSNIPFI